MFVGNLVEISEKTNIHSETGEMIKNVIISIENKRTNEQ